MGANVILRGLPGTQVERAQRLGRSLAQWADELAVVVVRDLPGAMVEFELLQRGERPVAFLCKLEPALLELVRRRESVLPRLRLAQKRQGNEHDADGREHGADDERERQIRTAVPS